MQIVPDSYQYQLRPSEHGYTNMHFSGKFILSDVNNSSLISTEIPFQGYVPFHSGADGMKWGGLITHLQIAQPPYYN